MTSATSIRLLLSDSLLSLAGSLLLSPTRLFLLFPSFLLRLCLHHGLRSLPQRRPSDRSSNVPGAGFEPARSFRSRGF